MWIIDSDRQKENKDTTKKDNPTENTDRRVWREKRKGKVKKQEI